MNCRIAWLLTLIILCPLLAFAAPVAIMPEAEPFGVEDDVLHLYVLDLVSADCMLLQHRGQNLLIDLGRAQQFSKLHALLDSLSVREAAVFNSHPHGDHIGGIFKLTDVCRVSAFYTCFPRDETEPGSAQRPAMRHLDNAGVPVIRLEDGDKVPLMAWNWKCTSISQYPY